MLQNGSRDGGGLDLAEGGAAQFVLRGGLRPGPRCPGLELGVGDAYEISGCAKMFRIFVIYPFWSGRNKQGTFMMIFNHKLLEPEPKEPQRIPLEAAGGDEFTTTQPSGSDIEPELKSRLPPQVHNELVAES